ncbi:MAG: hypothetical protein K2F57_01415, partial [Candidatus Gastranaerophilales bacterium]|nr:hypothetical protein [Candidatus Gastranaerophilales bacterium]
ATPGETASLDWVWVDINGGSKPNRFGRDVFFLQRLPDGQGVQPYGHKSSDNTINDNCKNNNSGLYCAEKIRRAGWKIDNSYPWK